VKRSATFFRVIAHQAPRVLKVIIVIMLLVIFGVAAFLVFGASEAYRSIDQCFDPKSGDYISDPVERGRFCSGAETSAGSAQ
jgi:hypothetical protein